MTIPGPMKNIEKAEVLTLKEQIAYQEGQVVSKTLAQNRMPANVVNANNFLFIFQVSYN